MLCKVITKTSKKLCVRAEPSITSNIVGYLYKDSIYNCEPVNDEWASVVSADTGINGYSSRHYLGAVNDDITITFTREELKSIVDYINSLLGE